MKKKFKKPEISESLYRKRFIVPNAVTLANMFCGFISIIYASSDRYGKAIVAVFLAIIFDGLDGRVARKLNATSKFGLEFDSLSDLVSFGLAPAFLVYFWGFKHQADEFGVLICFIYAICAASRLARFNISAENLASFNGMPSPGAAVFVVSFVNLMLKYKVDFDIIPLASFVMLASGYLMVSNIEFISIKMLKLNKIKIIGQLAIALVIWLIWYRPAIGLFALSAIYALSGPYMVVYRSIKKKTITVDTIDTKE